MPSLDFAYLDRLSFTPSNLSAIQRLGEARGRQDLFVRQFPAQLDTLRSHAVVESTESSNRIEGIVAAPGRIVELVVSRVEPRDRSEQEIAGYRDALQLIHESHAAMPFTPHLMLQLHQMLYRYEPGAGGRWKMTDNEIVDADERSGALGPPRARRPGGVKGAPPNSLDPSGRVARVRFKPTPAVATPQAMSDLAVAYRAALDDRRIDPLVAVPLAVLDFLCIHPFTDGNGRAARLLTLLLLYQCDYRVGRYISLERIIEESRETYYEALHRSSQDWHEGAHDAHPWLQYFWGMLIRAYGEFEDRVESLRGSKTDQVRMAAARRRGAFAISDIERDCPGVSRDMVRHVLRQMRAEGRLRVEGAGRGAKWRAVESPPA